MLLFRSGIKPVIQKGVMRLLREKHTKQRSVSFTEEMHDKIEATAKRFNVSFGSIVRACVENDLNKLIDRESKRRKPKRKLG